MSGGVLVSRSGGTRWEAGTFGLLDLDVLALSVSPAFEQDETIFAATSTGMFRSPNGARAWREIPAPVEGFAVQCLAISPDFFTDNLLFAGTDGAGMFCSRDRGASWQPLAPALRDASINAIVLSPGFAVDRTALIATASDLYVSHDAGERWSHCADAPGALCLAVAPSFPVNGLVLVGLAEGGVLRSTGSLADWQSVRLPMQGP
jgi:hypothetical protein